MLRPQPLFAQDIIAVIWDFDKTLTPGYMEEPLFNHFGVDGRSFWEETNRMEEFLRKDGLDLVSADSIYLQHILTYVREETFKGLSNDLLYKLGSEIAFCPGIPEFLQTIREFIARSESYRAHHVSVEHYVISTGLRRMILGSKIAPLLEGVWGCEFVERFPKPGYLKYSHGSPKPTGSGEIVGIGYSIDNTTKTRAIFEINKGSNKYSEIDVNSFIPYEDRRIPFQNMVYIADGPSDVPVFSVLMQYGGKTVGVYKPKDITSFKQMNRLRQEQRVQDTAPADYREGEPAYLAILTAVDEIASRIVDDRLTALRKRVGQPPRHLVDAQEELVEQLKLEAAIAPEPDLAMGATTSGTPITDRTLDSKQDLFVEPVEVRLEGPVERRVLARLRRLTAEIENDTHVPITPDEI